MIGKIRPLSLKLGNATPCKARTQQKTKMKKVKQKTRGFEPLLSLPENADEFNSAVGDPNACFTFAIREAIYRGLLPKIWRKVFDGAKEAFGVERKVLKEEKDKEGKVTKVMEPDSAFAARLKKEVPHEKMASFLQECADEVGFDLSAVARSKKPEKMHYGKADDLIASVDAGKTDWKKVAAVAKQKGATTQLAFDEDGNVDRDVLAQVLKEVYENSPLI